MDFKKAFANTAPYFLPTGLFQKFYSASWQKSHIELKLREHDDAILVKTIPLPYLELQFMINNHLPVELQIHGASAEIWLGKPIIQFTSFMSDSLKPNEHRECFRAYTFLNPYQADLLNPPKKDTLPPNLSINLTIHCRSVMGALDKSVKATWRAPVVR